MLKTTFNYNEFYNLMISILNSSLNLSTMKLNESDQFNNHSYPKFRKIIWPDSNFLDGEDLNTLYRSGDGNLKVIKSSMKFVSIVVVIPEEISDDVLLIGPFLETQLNENFIESVMKENHIEENLRDTIFTYYKSLPVINSVTVISTLNSILSAFIKDYHTHIAHINFDEKKIKKIDYVNRDDSEFNSEYYKKYREYLSHISSCVVLGKFYEAKEYLKLYIQLTGFFKEQSIDQIKHNLYMLNSRLESSLLKSSIPGSPVYLLYKKIEVQIKNEVSLSSLEKLPYKILKNYCLLSNNFNLQNYSLTVRNAIEYINLNLNMELSLSSISEVLDKNPSFLSNQFKRETGKTITKHIQEMRIEKAITLLTTTDLSIQEISESVGINDLSWFSKLFKKIVGVSPTQYRATKFS